MAKRGQNEGSIYQRTDGRWVACINLGWLNGRRTRKHFYGRTRREVQGKLTEALRDQQLGLPVLMEKQTVSQYLSRWLEDVVRRKNRPSTYRSYEQLVRVHIGPAIGSVLLTKVTTQQVRAMLNEKHDSGLSSRTVQYLHAILRKALNVAWKDQVVARNVAALVDPPRVAAKEVQPFTTHQARAFLKAVQTDRLEALFTVAISLGLRQGEALALRWRDIDLEAGTLRVRYALQRLKSKWKVADGRRDLKEISEPDPPVEIHLVEPKTKRSRRTIDLPAVTRTALSAHRSRQAIERNLCGSSWVTPKVHCEGSVEESEDFVFTTTIGTPLDGRNITKRFQRILKNANIPAHRFHDLRHTAATLLAVQGVHPKAIQSVLGWDQVSMVDRYAHFVDEMRRDAATKMDAILDPVAVNLAVKAPDSKVT
ncbi:MAG TPA: tyrosine-type recombinase/integrase [Bryobacteraceae bacterium]|nr:tyrosine-type recombinase/integrase [Bryobacteraceae bacterium]